MGCGSSSGAYSCVHGQTINLVAQEVLVRIGGELLTADAASSGILHPIVMPGFWKVIWEEDLRAPSGDLINQVFYLVVT